MLTHTPSWYDEQYNNRARIPEHPAILQDWLDSSAAARARHPELVEAAYGPAPREKMDIFPARAGGAPVLVYLHGGYWRALDKRDQSFVAPPLVDAGAMVVLPDYSLCPEVTVEYIVLQTVRALVWVHAHSHEYGGDPARIVLAGHSAGGHLAAMMLSCRWAQVHPALPADLVKAALAISGIYDLEPLRHAPFLEADLGLTAASALRLSPAFMPAPSGSLAVVVGAGESEEFLRQAALIREAWGTKVMASEIVPDRNHMDVLQELARPGSNTHQLALDLLGIAPASSRS